LLNKSKGNMYSWLDATWNPVRGKCSHACVYCWANQPRLLPLRLEKKELLTDLNAGQFIFVCSSTDLFADNVPEEWIMQVLADQMKLKRSHRRIRLSERGQVELRNPVPHRPVVRRFSIVGQCGVEFGERMSVHLVDDRTRG